MTSYSALGPVSAAIMTALNISAVTALATGGVFNVIPQGTRFPAVLFEVTEPQQMGGFGTKPGVGHFPELDVFVHAFSPQGGLLEAQDILEQCIKALADPPTVTGYGSWAIFKDSETDLGDQVVAGVPVYEIVARFRLYVELF